MSPTDDPVRPAAVGPATGRALPRRWILTSGAAVVAGGAAGVGIGFLRTASNTAVRPAPAALVAAVASERDLLALTAAAVRSDPRLRATATMLTNDHTAHLRALQSALAAYDQPRPTASPSPSAGGASSARARLRSAERAASTAAAERALRLTGAVATLLASIAACEASHGELLT